jgi:hypothetical protein
MGGQKDILWRNKATRFSDKYKGKIVNVQKIEGEKEIVMFLIEVSVRRKGEVSLLPTLESGCFTKLAEELKSKLNEDSKEKVTKVSFWTNNQKRGIKISVEGKGSSNDIKDIRDNIKKCLENVIEEWGKGEEVFLGKLSIIKKKNEEQFREKRKNWKVSCEYIADTLLGNMKNIHREEDDINIMFDNVKRGFSSLSDVSKWITIGFVDDGNYNMEERWTRAKYRVYSYSDEDMNYNYNQGVVLSSTARDQ